MVESPRELLTRAWDQYPQHARYPAAIVNVSEQVLYVVPSSFEEYTATYPVSTSRFGMGQDEGSRQTPLGIHCVRVKIGADAEFAEIFRARERTHTVATVEPAEISTGEDYITSRILWLAGLEDGVNKGAGVDSYARYIYIHGTHEEGLVGQPASVGCIRMKNRDVMDLFDRLEVSSLVVIG